MKKQKDKLKNISPSFKTALIALLIILALLIGADITIIYYLKKQDCAELFDMQCSQTVEHTQKEDSQEENQSSNEETQLQDIDSDQSSKNVISDPQLPREEIDLEGNWFGDQQYPQELLDLKEDSVNMICSPAYRITPWNGLDLKQWPEEAVYTYRNEKENGEYEQLPLDEKHILQFIQRVNEDSASDSIYNKVNAVKVCDAKNLDNPIVLWLTQEVDSKAYLTAKVQYLTESPSDAVTIPNSTMYMTCNQPLAYTEDRNLYLGCDAADGMWELYKIYKINLSSDKRSFTEIKSCRLTYSTLEEREQGEDEINVECK